MAIAEKSVMRFFILFFFSSFIIFNLYSEESYECIASAKKFEKKYNLPDNLLVSVALTESGKKIKNGDFVAWPWTINARGKGKFFKSKDEALEHVINYLRRGRKNIDIGCMQVNHMYHPNAFVNLEKAFDPEINVEWSANLIKNLYIKYGSYREAVGYYHSYRTTKKNQYASKVFKTWRELNKNDIYADINIKPKEKIGAIKVTRNEVNLKNISYNNENNVINSKKKSFTNKNHKKNNMVNSEYIIARMEKVKFFRNYFLK